METKIPDWTSREDGKADPITDFVRAFGRWSENSMSDQKLYISSARGWRDQDSLLTKLYAIDALEEKPWMIYGRDAASPFGYTKAEYIKASGGQYIDTGFIPNKRFVTIGDDAANIDCEWKEKIFDKRVYRFINDGDGIRLFGSGMEPIKIELSFSELVGEE